MTNHDNDTQKKLNTQAASGDYKLVLKRLAGYLIVYKTAFMAVLAAAILSTAFTVISPMVLGMAITEIFQGVMGEGISYSAILPLLLWLAGLYVFSSALTYVQEYLMVGVAQKVVYKLRSQLNDKLGRLPVRYFDKHSHGDILSRGINDVEKISSTLQQSLVQVTVAIATIAGITVMMLLISPVLALVVLITIPLSMYVTKKIIKRSQKYFKGQQQILGSLNSYVEEMYSGHSTIKSFVREKETVRQFQQTNTTLYEVGWRAQFISSFITPLIRFVSNFVYVVVCVAGSILVTQRTIMIGDVQAFILYVRLFSQPITRIANISNILQSTVAAAERIFELLDEPEEAEYGLKEPKLQKGKVAFKGVSFSYNKQKPLLQDITFQAEPGQAVAIVGPTGAGKSTVINMLMRFYNPDKGSIELDGEPIHDLHEDYLREQISVVLQDTWLFHGTVKENISYGHKKATDDDIIEAAKTACADEFIKTLPDGYDTMIDENASNLSAGQKQLLTIARAVISNPQLLVLDEATSNVDTRTELHIQQALDNIMKGRTTFVIAHRLSTIEKADVILVMKEGTVAERGTHSDLLKASGVYADLYNSQFQTELQALEG